MRLILILLAIFVFAQTKLVYLSELFRHGARYPVSDIYDGKDTKPFHGRLTGVGMRQQYLLGSYLKRDYVDQNQLFNGTLSPREVEVFSDGSERCIESAYAHVAGLFQLGQGEWLPEGIASELLIPPFESTPSSLTQEASTFAGEFALSKGYQPVPIKDGQTFFPKCTN